MTAARLEALHPVLASSDDSASVRFYERLGFRAVFVDDPGTPRYAAVARDDVELHLQWHELATGEAGGDRPTYRFLVADVDALFAELEARGAIPAEAASPWARPGDTPWGTREFHLRDPDGNGLQFYRPRGGTLRSESVPSSTVDSRSGR